MRKNKGISISRAFGYLWIVFIWHFSTYIEGWDITSMVFPKSITHGMLMMFFYISGTLMVAFMLLLYLINYKKLISL